MSELRRKIFSDSADFYTSWRMSPPRKTKIRLLPLRKVRLQMPFNHATRQAGADKRRGSHNSHGKKGIESPEFTLVSCGQTEMRFNRVANFRPDRSYLKTHNSSKKRLGAVYEKSANIKHPKKFNTMRITTALPQSPSKIRVRSKSLKIALIFNFLFHSLSNYGN